MSLGRFLAGRIAASRRHGKEAHENCPGPPNQSQVNALILWQLLYVHYAARDGWHSVLCVSSEQNLIFNRSELCHHDLHDFAFCTKFNTLSFFWS